MNLKLVKRNPANKALQAACFAVAIVFSAICAPGLAGVVDTTGTGVISRPDMLAGADPMLDREERTRARWFNTSPDVWTV